MGRGYVLHAVALILGVLAAAPAQARSPLGSPGLRNRGSSAQHKITPSVTTSGYLDFTYRPSPKDMVAVYRVEPKRGKPINKVAEHLAAESSIGTWTNISTADPRAAQRLKPHVYSIQKRGKRAYYVKIAYPQDLFEAGNMPQILSAVAGNIFGMKDIKRLRLVDVAFSERQLEKLPGPTFGIDGVRARANVKDRPMVGTIVKPKVGLSPEKHAKVAFNAWVGGLDLVKDDENLTSMSFNQFATRMQQTYRALNKAEKMTGQKKVYVPNVTAETGEMLKRAALVKKLGGTTVMVDIVTAGWSGVQSLRKAFPDMIIHGHRAGHAAMTRDKTHGVSMLAMAKFARAAGIDQLHIGTANVGKMHGGKSEVQRIQKAISSQKVSGNSIYLSQDWGKMKPTMPIASGGLHPGQMSTLVDRMGTNIIAQFGGGCHGHPDGTVAGARAIRQATQAKMSSMPLQDYARNHPELQRAINTWGTR